MPQASQISPTLILEKDSLAISSFMVRASARLVRLESGMCSTSQWLPASPNQSILEKLYHFTRENASVASSGEI